MIDAAIINYSNLLIQLHIYSLFTMFSLVRIPLVCTIVLVTCISTISRCPCTTEVNTPIDFTIHSNICIYEKDTVAISLVDTIRMRLVTLIDDTDDSLIVRRCLAVLKFDNSSIDTGSTIIDTISTKISDEVSYRNSYNHYLRSVVQENICPGACRPVPLLVLPSLIVTNPKQLLTSSDSNKAHSSASNNVLLCSYTIDMLIRDINSNSVVSYKKMSDNKLVLLVLQLLLRRRLLECYEYAHWPEINNYLTSELVFPSKTNDISSKDSVQSSDHGEQRRSINGLVLWIGSTGNIELVYDQAKVIENRNSYNGGGNPERSHKVLGWIATEDIYDCRKDSTKCNERGGNGKYKFLPSSAINYSKEGWRCAQRRPIRALSHVLLLFDIENYLILLDDDTFLNHNLFMKLYGNYFRSNPLSRNSTMTNVEPINNVDPINNDRAINEALFMGEFRGKTGPHGHLSTGGIFAGGAGYAFNQESLQRLNSKEIKYFGFEFDNKLPNTNNLKTKSIKLAKDSHRSIAHIRHLGVLAEAVTEQLKCSQNSQHSAESSDNTKSSIGCIHTTPNMRNNASDSSDSNRDYVVELTIRLIDLCMNLMAAEHTCQHSDHSIGRCLLYGAYATPVSNVCHSISTKPEHQPLPSIDTVKLGMCFISENCDINRHVTCHRYKANYTNNNFYEPTKTHPAGYYGFYSSMFDGNFSDTYDKR